MLAQRAIHAHARFVIEADFIVLNEWVMPAIVLGVGERIWDAADRPWLTRFQHQYMGNICMQQDLSGLVLPLRDRPNAAALVADLVVLSCDSPEDAAIRARPDLEPLHLCGGPYRPEQIEVLDRVLAKGPPLPKVIAASEALVELDASDPLRFFEGWSVLSAELPRSVHAADPLAPATVMGPVDLHEDQRLDDRLLEATRELVGPGKPLRAFLVWWNSD